MDIASLCTRRVITIDRSASLQQAALMMREHHVGSLVVIEGNSEAAHVCGIVTDRDLAIEVLARGLDGTRAQVGQLLQGQPFSVLAGANVGEAIVLMQTEGIRRLLVRDEEGNLVGLVSFDDLLRACIEPLSGLAQVVRKGIERETVERQALAAPSRPAQLRVPSIGTAGWRPDWDVVQA